MAGRMVKAAAAAVAAAMTLVQGAARAEEFKVGVILPFSGVYAALGEDIEGGFALGVEHFGDKLGAHTLSLLREDTKADPSEGLAAAKKLVLRERVDALTGVVSSAVLGALRDFVDGAKVPLVVANAGNDLATGEKCSPYVIRVSFSNSQIVRPLGAWMKARGIESVYMMAPDYAAGRQMTGTFSAAFQAAGGRIVGEAYTPLEGVTDYGPYLTTAASSGADALFAFYAGGAAVAFVTQHHAFDLGETLPLYGPGWLVSEPQAVAQGPAADGVIGALNYVSTIDTDANRRFQEGWAAAHGGEIGSEYAVAGYDAARLIIEAIAASGGDKAAFRAALAKVRFEGPRGPLEIDPATNNVVQTIYLFETVVGAEGQIQRLVLDSAPAQRDAPNGCVMAPL